MLLDAIIFYRKEKAGEKAESRKDSLLKDFFGIFR